jgi:Putative adhesin
LDVAGSIDVQTDSGGIRIGQTQPGTIHAKADSGGAQVKLVSSAGYDVRASSESGRVNVADVTVRGAISRNRTEGKVRGGGPLVDVHVGSGTVTIE